jgi:hypothetical protein
MKKKKEVLEFFGVHLSPDIAKTLREHADLYGRSLSGEIRVMIRDCIALREQTTRQFAKPKRKK